MKRVQNQLYKVISKNGKVTFLAHHPKHITRKNKMGDKNTV